MNSKSNQACQDALKKFEFDNDIKFEKFIYDYDKQEYENYLDSKPWKKDPHYFQKVQISAIALIKMVSHAKLGGNQEIMGHLQGIVKGDTFIVVDTQALPVIGTETRVNAGAEANEYSTQLMELNDKVGRREYLCGWYHSHPSYGCWLSGIDVETQKLMQMQDPQVAIVIDPVRTLTCGKVEIGAFRTYPPNYVPPDSQITDQVIPLEKIEDFGVHYQKYYPLEVSYYKTALDSQIIDVLWNKYWISSLSNSSLFMNSDYFTEGITDLCKKAQKIVKGQRGQRIMNAQDLIKQEGKQEYKDFYKFAMENNSAILNEQIKRLLFSKNC